MTHSSFPYTGGLVLTLFLLLSLVLSACSDEPARTEKAPLTPKSTPAAGTPVPGTSGVAATNVPTVLPTNPPNEMIKVPTPLPGQVTVGGTIVGAQIQDADTLHYYKTTNQASFDYLKLLYSASLTRRNPTDLTLDKGAAESWTVDVAQSTVTFRLKDGLKWSNGQPLTSADYLWTYEQAKKPENNWPYATAALNGIVSYTAPDARTLVIKLKSYTVDIVSRADVIEPLPKQVWEKLDWNNPAKNQEINKPSVVSGPWLLKEWKPGKSITFSRNPNSTLYTPPALETLSFVIVSDVQEAAQKLKAGEVDFYYPSASEFASFTQLTNLQSYRSTPGRATFQYIGFNFRKSLLQDKRIRQALAYATDRQGLLEKAGLKQGRVLYSDVLPWHPMYVDNIAKFAVDINKAKDLLTGAGYTGIGTKLADKSGAAVAPLRLLYVSPNAANNEIAQNLKQAYAGLGLSLELVGVDFNTYSRILNSTAVNPPAYDLWVGSWQTDYAPETFGEVWQNVPELNSGAYKNDKLGQLYASALVEPDAAKRNGLMAQIQQTEADDLPYIYLYAQYELLVVNKRVSGVAQTLAGAAYCLYTDWYLPKP